MAALIFSMPFVTLAQQPSVQAEAIIAAEQDANKDVNKPFWFGAGCFLSGLSFLANSVWLYCAAVWCYWHLLLSAGNPPPARLIGKSSEYITAYTSAYQLKRGSIQAQWTSAGLSQWLSHTWDCSCEHRHRYWTWTGSYNTVNLKINMVASTRGMAPTLFIEIDVQKYFTLHNTLVYAPFR